MPTPMQVLALHRYYVWANRMRTHFDELLGKHSINLFQSGDGSIEGTMYMSLWYAGLYTVIEGWRRLELSDPAIDALLAQPDHVRCLKLYRHGVAHFQPAYHDDRFIEIMQDSEATVPWIRELNREFGRWFLEHFRSKRSMAPPQTS